MAVSANNQPLPLRSLNVPSWVVDSDIPMLPVKISDSSMQFIELAVGRNWLKFCKSKQEVIELVTQVSHDSFV
jgi:hypothetical protein